MPGQERVFFCNSGTEAVETAIKLARAATGRAKLLFCDHAFHGLTMGALSLNGDADLSRGLRPAPGRRRGAFPGTTSRRSKRALRAGDVAAFIVEPIQGKGVNLPR